MSGIKTRTTRMALEKRIVFDAAAVSTAVKTTTDANVTDMNALSDQLASSQQAVVPPDIVTVGNRPPVANDDVATTDSVTPVTVDVLTNDSDADGDNLIVTSISSGNDIGYKLQLSVAGNNFPQFTLTNTSTQADITGFTFSLGDANYNFDFIRNIVSNGISFTLDGVETSQAGGNNGLRSTSLPFTFSGFNPSKSYAFEADIDQGAFNNNIDFQGVFFNNGETPNASITVNFSDGTSLSTTLPETPVIDSAGNYTFEQTERSGGEAIINEDNTITFTPHTGFIGTAVFSYAIRDVNGAESTANLIINVTEPNHMPVANADQIETNEDTSVTFDALANDSDADNDVLTITRFTQSQNGTVVLNENGSFTFTPDADYSGKDSFSYEVNDGHGGTDVATVNIDVRQVVMQDFNTRSDDMLIPDISVPFGTILDFTQGEHGTVTLNESDNTLTYTANDGYVGKDSYSYTVRDQQGVISTTVVNVNVFPTVVTQTWTGGAGDGDFFNADNWSLGLVPENGDSVVIPDQPGDISLANMDITLHSLTLSDTLSINSGSVTVTGDATIDASGVLNIAPGQSFTVTNGTLTNNGLIEGKGELIVSPDATFINNGTLAPGNSPGRLDIQGDFVLTKSGQIVFEIAGTTPATQYDQIIATGTAFLNGTIKIVFINGLTSLPEGTSLQLLQAASIQGNPTINAPDGFNLDLLTGQVTFSTTTTSPSGNVTLTDNGFTVATRPIEYDYPDYYNGISYLDDYNGFANYTGDTYSQILQGLVLSLTDNSSFDYASDFERLLSDDPTAAGDHDKSLEEKLDEEASHFDASQREILDILLQAEEAMFCEA